MSVTFGRIRTEGRPRSAGRHSRTDHTDRRPATEDTPAPPPSAEALMERKFPDVAAMGLPIAERDATSAAQGQARARRQTPRRAGVDAGAHRDNGELWESPCGAAARRPADAPKGAHNGRTWSAPEGPGAPPHSHPEVDSRCGLHAGRPNCRLAEKRLMARGDASGQRRPEHQEAMAARNPLDPDLTDMSNSRLGRQGCLLERSSPRCLPNSAPPRRASLQAARAGLNYGRWSTHAHERGRASPKCGHRRRRPRTAATWNVGWHPWWAQRPRTERYGTARRASKIPGPDGPTELGSA